MSTPEESTREFIFDVLADFRVRHLRNEWVAWRVGTRGETSRHKADSAIGALKAALDAFADEVDEAMYLAKKATGD